MTEYAIAWYPDTDNLGDDLRTLAAMRLLPRVDRVLDTDHLDAPLPGLGEGDRLVTLMTGSVLRERSHWPPDAHIAPVCVGVHASAEDVWGLPFAQLDGAGRDYLTACAPVGCRDQRTARLMEQLGIPHDLTACLTLTLERPNVAEAPQRPYICCVDVPEEAEEALRESAARDGAEVDLRSLTHQHTDTEADFQHRMDGVKQLLAVYAGAQFVVTRRLHCAMACLAIGTPVLLVYNSGYEDITRFAPMDQMLRTMDMDAFVRQIKAEGFPRRWENPPGVEAWKEKLRQAVQEGLRRAEAMKLPVVSPSEAQAWRIRQLRLMADSAARKIRRLEQEQYESLHEKFTMLSREDSVKSSLNRLLHEKEVVRGLEKLALRERLQALPWYRRPGAWLRQRGKGADAAGRAAEPLDRLGWPDHQE